MKIFLRSLWYQIHGMGVLRVRNQCAKFVTLFAQNYGLSCLDQL